MFHQTFKNIEDVLRREAGCSSKLDYTEQTSQMVFLKYLDDCPSDHDNALTGEALLQYNS